MYIIRLGIYIYGGYKKNNWKLYLIFLNRFKMNCIFLIIKKMLKVFYVVLW